MMVMISRWLHKIVNSVFFKLLLVIVITGVCINLAVGGFFLFLYKGSMKNTPFRDNLVNYLQYLIMDLGSPPDRQRAEVLSRKLSIEIGVEGPDGKWATTDTFPSVRQMNLKEFSEYPNFAIGKYRGESFLIIRQGETCYVFDMVKSYIQPRFLELRILLLIVLLTGMLVCVYYVIRRILRPITWLNKGVREVSSGNLSHRLPVKKSDELGALAEAFNYMTGRIREMLHARDRLLLDVSHELRSPLTRMKVSLEFLPDTPAKENIHEDISDMESMISEILETQRLRSDHGRLRLETAGLGRVVREVIASFAYASPGIVYETPDGDATLTIDIQRVKIVLKNIFDNAIKYSAGTSEPVRVALELKPPYCILHIADSGQGIPAEDLPHIFEPFYRVDKSRSKHTGGYGLGLSICKTIMEAHNGRIVVKSSPGKGTTIFLYFPVECS